MSSPPFTTRVLEQSLCDSETTAERVDFSPLLPATTRDHDDIVVPHPKSEFLRRDLLVQRLNDVHDSLWLCGRPMPPRSLHHQQLLSREIIISEDVGLHMLWWKNRIFFKPMPLYLLDPDFWKAHIVESVDKEHEVSDTDNIDLCARGFLFSYMALIAYKSDFRIAQDRGLLPPNLTWEGWKTLSAEFLANHRYDSVNRRYWYGELRLSRLNKVYCFQKGYIFRGYSRVASHAVYGDLVRDNLALLASILSYFVIALAAMQVGLGVDKLYENKTFQRTTYGFTIFSLIAPLIAAAFLLLFVLAMIASNWRATKSYEKKRFRRMQVSWPSNEFS